MIEDPPETPQNNIESLPKKKFQRTTSLIHDSAPEEILSPQPEPKKKLQRTTSLIHDSAPEEFMEIPLDLLPNIAETGNKFEDMQNNEYRIWEHKIRYQKLSSLLIQQKDQIAQKLIQHSHIYDKGTRTFIDKYTQQEIEYMEKQSAIRTDMRDSFKKWRRQYFELLHDSNEGLVLRNHLRTTPGCTKFVSLSLADSPVTTITETDWSKIKLIDRKNISIFENKLLGEGSYGQVYEGIVFGTMVAVKVLKKEVILKNKIYLKAFENEIKLFSDLHHTNISQFLGGCVPLAGEEPYYALITELSPNGSLFDLLYKVKGVPVKLSFSKKMFMIGEMVEALYYLHHLSPPIYHLDLTSKNVLLDENYSIKITDFGLAKLCGQKAVFRGIIGTPSYMAPEMIEMGINDPNMKLDKVDIYAFGILTNELISEELPYCSMTFHTITKFESLKNIVVQGDTPEVHRPKLASPLSEYLSQLICKCWKLDPEKRPTFEQLREEKSWERAKEDMIDDGHKTNKTILKPFDKSPVSFTHFLWQFAEALCEPKRLFYDKSAPKKITHHIRVVMAALEIGNIKTDNVSKENVERLLKWFSKKTMKRDYLDILYALFTTPSFFGILLNSEAHLILINHKATPGHYLFRWSKEHNLFVIDFRTKKEGEIITKIIETESIEQLLKRDLKRVLEENQLKEKKYLKKGRPAILTQLTIKEEYIITSLPNYVTSKNLNSNDVDLLKMSNLAHYNFIL